MSPETLPIDRRFPGVGRIARASGTFSPAVKRRVDRLLTDLYGDARLDILRALRDGTVTFMQVLDASRRNALHELPVGATMPLLANAMRAWVETLTVPRDASQKHLDSIETSVRYFERKDAKARIADLPRILESLRTSLGARHPRSFNLCRAHALAFVRSELKRTHPLWLACAAVELRKVERKPPRAVVTPAMFRTRFPRPQHDPIDAGAWSMATSGMGQKEYWGPWETQRDRVRIGGTKRKGRVRDVPLVQAPTVPRLSRDRWEKRFRERMRGLMTPYDLRRTYANWLEEAGVPRTRRRMYLGHSTKDVSDLYERHEVTAFLAEDAKKMKAFLAARSRIGHKVREAKRA